MTYYLTCGYSRTMSAEQPLTAALAEAASRFVGASKVGNRKGSIAAVARAMTDAGVEISSNTLNRKLAGAYPLNSDEIGALAEVLGVDPDDIWADAIRIMRASRDADPIEAELLAGLSPRNRKAVEALSEAPAPSSVRPTRKHRSA